MSSSLCYCLGVECLCSASDVFMFGVLLYCVWTGGLFPFCEEDSYYEGTVRPPADWAEKHNVVLKSTSSPTPHLERIDDAHLRDLLTHCLALDRRSRPKVVEVGTCFKFLFMFA